MRKALLPMIAALALCGGATAALVATARAQPETRKPMLVALVKPGETAAPPTEGGRPEPRPAAQSAINARIRQMCEDGYARQAAALAYAEAKLSLTAAEQPLFERWKQVRLDNARRRSGECTTRMRPMNDRMPTVIDRMARRETMLKQRLAAIEAERPALEAFYNSLSAEQKHEFGRDAARLMRMRERMAGGGPEMMGPGMMGHPMMGRGMMGRGMMGGQGMMRPGMMGPPMPPPEGPGDAPPAPPPQ